MGQDVKDQAERGVATRSSDDRRALSSAAALPRVGGSDSVVPRSPLTTAISLVLGRPNAPQQVLQKPGNLAQQLAHSYDRENATGIRVIAAVIGLSGLCTAVLPVNGAVAVMGTLVSGSGTYKVQNLAGGVISEILVKNGARVARGDVVARLEEGANRANFQAAQTQLDEANTQLESLTAELNGTAQLGWTAELAERASHNEALRSLLKSEAEHFQARTNAFQQRVNILRSHLEQVTEEGTGLQVQLAAKDQQAGFLKKELNGLQNLYQRQLVALPRLSAVARETAQLEGERGQLRSAIAENHSKIEEAKLQLDAAAAEHRAALGKEIGELNTRRSELSARHAQARYASEKIELRAPASGTVTGLGAHATGGVLAAADILMTIVPDDNEFIVEAHVPAKDIDQVSQGQSVSLKFEAFDRSTTPDLQGVVSYVAADAVHEPQSNASVYNVNVSLPAQEAGRVEGLALRAGMPADVFIQTGKRTILSYLFKPLVDQLHHAFRER